jgi:hypothetical protein
VRGELSTTPTKSRSELIPLYLEYLHGMMEGHHRMMEGTTVVSSTSKFH